VSEGIKDPADLVAHGGKIKDWFPHVPVIL
jgi:hypothetical protein